MPSTESPSHSSDTAPPAPRPLPKGYLWRLCVVLVLLLGGAVCLIFFNSILGSLMTLGGLAFGKMSGLNEMVDADREASKA